jgi:hypothetical protein
MRRLVIIATAVASIAIPRIAHAGCRGGGGGGGGGGGRGGGGGGGGGGTRSGVRACEDTSDVVGYRRCTKFGAWGTNLRMPHIIIEAGVIVRQFGSLLDSQVGTVAHGDESFVYRVVSRTGGRPIDTAVLSTMRAGIGLSHGFYAAVEADLGGLAQPGAATTEMMSTGVFGTPALHQERGFVVDTLATAGVHGAIGAAGLGVELSGGLRSVSYSFQSDYHTCEQSTGIAAFAPVAEARARGELWISPWLTAGVTIGTSVIEQHTWMGGLYLGVHSRAFGGER